MRVTAERTDVEFGVAFAVTVASAWSTKLVPEEWSDDVLNPLIVELEDVQVLAALRNSGCRTAGMVKTTWKYSTGSRSAARGAVRSGAPAPRRCATRAGSSSAGPKTPRSRSTPAARARPAGRAPAE